MEPRTTPRTWPDRETKIRRLRRMFWIGVAVAALGTLLACAGLSVFFTPKDRYTFEDYAPGMRLAAVCTIFVAPLGVGAVVAAGGGLLIVRSFSLRALLLAITVFGLVLGGWIGVLRPALGDRLETGEGSVVFHFSIEPPGQNPAAPSISYVIIGVRLFDSHSLVSAGLPFLGLPLIWIWPMRKRSGIA